jgi:hypothetical protein
MDAWIHLRSGTLSIVASDFAHVLSAPVRVGVQALFRGIGGGVTER